MRDGDTVKHYRIRQLDEGGYFIARRITFRTLQELVDHYKQGPDGLCVNLRKPCAQVIANIVSVSYKDSESERRIPNMCCSGSSHVLSLIPSIVGLLGIKWRT